MGKHNWFAVAIDLAIVVLGVFLGTQVSNWNADRIARQAGHGYLTRIARDVSDNQRDMQARAAYYLQVKHFSERLLSDLDGEARVPDEELLIVK